MNRNPIKISSILAVGSRSLLILRCAISVMMCTWMVTGASAQNIETPQYLKDARALLFMANETGKFCGEIEEDNPIVLLFLANLKTKLAQDGITDVNSQLGPVPMSEIIAMASRIQIENGGPFGFSEENYCAYGRREIEKGSVIGRLLKLTAS